METIISSLVASFGLCPDRVGGPKESLVSDLEENLRPSRVEWNWGQPRHGYFWPVSPSGSSGGPPSELLGSRPLLIITFSCYQRLDSYVLVGTLVQGVVEGHLGSKGRNVLRGIRAAIVMFQHRQSEIGRYRLVLYSGMNKDPTLELSSTSSLDLTNSLRTSSSLWLTWRSCSLTELVEFEEMTSDSRGTQATSR
ncbi:hypothetical protein BHM03_00058904 [Ensete ventricosum]|nr:hypothetical protein BHM03_00058904 [Ensete ventricosum]